MLLAAEHVIRRPGPLPVAPGWRRQRGCVLLSGHPESAFHAAVATGALRRAARLCSSAPRGRAAPPLLGLTAGWCGGRGAGRARRAPVRRARCCCRRTSASAPGSAADSLLPRRYALGALHARLLGPPDADAAGAVPARARGLRRAPAAAARGDRASPCGPRGTRARARAVRGARACSSSSACRRSSRSSRACRSSRSGHNTRLVALAMLCVALLAGWGLDELLERARPMRAGARASCRALAAMAVLAVVRRGDRPRPAARASATRSGWPPAFGDGPSNLDPDAGAVIRARRAARLARAGRRGGRAGRGAHGREAARGAVRRGGVRARRRRPRARRHGLQPGDRPRARRAARRRRRSATSRRAARRASWRSATSRRTRIPLRFRLEEARGYDLPIERRLRHALAPHDRAGVPVAGRAVSHVHPARRCRASRPPALRALRRLGVDRTSCSPRSDPVLRLPGLRLVYDGPDARVYAIDRALPRAWVAGAQQVVDGGDAALDAFTGPGSTLAPSRHRGAGRRAARGRAPARRDGARIVAHRARARDGARRARRAGGMLVLGDLDYPGWKATRRRARRRGRARQLRVPRRRASRRAPRRHVRLRAAVVAGGVVVSLLALSGCSPRSSSACGGAAERAPPRPRAFPLVDSLRTIAVLRSSRSTPGSTRGRSPRGRSCGRGRAGSSPPRGRSSSSPGWCSTGRGSPRGCTAARCPPCGRSAGGACCASSRATGSR